MNRKLEGQVALVTGASSGIGAGVAKALAREGAAVAINYSSSEEKAKKVFDEIQQEGGTALMIKGDVSKEDEVLAMYDELFKQFGTIDILINNAGVYLDGEVSVFDVDEKIIQETLEVNFYGAFSMCKAFVPIMRQNGYGRIVNISSGYGAMNEMAGYEAAYRISKAALNALTLIMADELRDGSIKVNAVCPGWVSTEMGSKLAPLSPETAARDIVHFALIDANGPTGRFFRYKKPIQW